MNTEDVKIREKVKVGLVQEPKSETLKIVKKKKEDHADEQKES